VKKYIKASVFFIGVCALGSTTFSEPNYKEHRYTFGDYYDFYIPFKKAIDRNDESDAQKQYDALLNERPDPFFSGYASAELARFYFKRGDNKTAQKKALALLSQGVVIKEKALKLLVQEALLRRNKKETLEWYGQLLIYCPNADRHGELWTKIKETYLDPVSLNDTMFTFKDKVGYLRNLVRKEYYSRAKELGLKLLQESPTLKDRAEVEFLLGFAHYKLFEVPTAAYFLNESYKHAPKSPLYHDTLFYLARAYEESSEIDKAQRTYKLCIKAKKDNEYAPRAYYHLTLLYKTYGGFDAFLKMKKEFSELFPLSYELEKLNWDLKWEETAKTKEVSSAVFQELFAKQDDGEWVLSRYKEIMPGAALSKAMVIHPLNYDVSHILLIKKMAKDTYRNAVIDRYDSLKDNKLSEMVLDEIRYRDVTRKVPSFEDNEALLYILLDRGNFYEAVEEGKNTIRLAEENRWPISDVMVKAVYPRAYLPLVQKYAKKYGVETELLLAIMREESQFFPLYENQKKIGLCPMEADVAKEVVWRIGETWTGSDVLKDPETSIKLGAYYLADLLKQFNGNTHLAVLAFHTSPLPAGKLQLKGISRSLYDVKNAIPNSGARDLVERVNDSYLAYRLLY